MHITTTVRASCGRPSCVLSKKFDWGLGNSAQRREPRRDLLCGRTGTPIISTGSLGLFRYYFVFFFLNISKHTHTQSETGGRGKDPCLLFFLCKRKRVRFPTSNHPRGSSHHGENIPGRTLSIRKGDVVCGLVRVCVDVMKKQFSHSLVSLSFLRLQKLKFSRSGGNDAGDGFCRGRCAGGQWFGGALRTDR